MTTILAGYGTGGAGLTPAPNGSQSHPPIDTTLRDVADDVTALRTQLNDMRTAYLALLAKLDADGGVTDTNYGTVAAPPAALASQLTIKG